MENLGSCYRNFPGVDCVSEEILTFREVAKLLKVADKTVYTMAQKGTMPAFKVGGLWRFRRQDLDAWISERLGRPGRDLSSTMRPSRPSDGRSNETDGDGMNTRLQPNVRIS
jgi:excisionase family DNA binding protein